MPAHQFVYLRGAKVRGVSLPESTAACCFLADGRAVASRAPEFLRSDTEVTLSPLQRRFVSCNGARRAWRHEEDDRVVWCVADEESQRALLEWVLVVPVVPTAVEKTIVAECIQRLLSGSSWTEADQHEIDDEEAWHGVLNLSPPSAAARLELHVRADAEAAVGDTLARRMMCRSALKGA